MKKLNNKGIIITEVISILFVPGAIPLFLAACIYKVATKKQLKLLPVKINDK